VHSHADPSVCSLPVETLSHNFPYALCSHLRGCRRSPCSLSNFAGAFPALDWVPNCHSNPIAQRDRRKRQRLPPSLLIENASGLIFRLPANSSLEAFPIKASDNSSRIVMPAAHHQSGQSGRRPFQVGESVIYQPPSVLDPFSPTVRNRQCALRAGSGPR